VHLVQQPPVHIKVVRADVVEHHKLLHLHEVRPRHPLTEVEGRHGLAPTGSMC